MLSETDGLGIDGIMEYVQSIAKSSETSVAVLGLANVSLWPTLQLLDVDTKLTMHYFAIGRQIVPH